MKEPLRAEIEFDINAVLPGEGYWYKNDGPSRTKTTIELLNDELWISGKKVVLLEDEGQTSRQVSTGLRIRNSLKGKSVLGALEHDFLRNNPEFFPESWKADENRRPKHIYFWRTVFYLTPTPVKGYNKVVKCWFENGEWQKYYAPLESRWHHASYSPVLE